MTARTSNSVAAIAITLLVVQSATACDGLNCSPWGGTWNFSWFGWNTWAYTPDYVGAPPYFSVRPPVYYSGRIQRSDYGSSPFPASEGEKVTARERKWAVEIQPQLIENPYFRAKPVDDRQGFGWSAPEQQVVVNPYR
ncbi:MAG: hypothetical protein FJ295_16080 [Planctomycetes bacterium]|nr:hypothetical protein [Planctomycetota bacterium]